MNTLKHSPFTLVELFLSIALFAMLSAFLYQMIYTIQTSWLTTDETLEVFENARNAFDIIELDLMGMTANNLDGEKILIDSAGTGVRDVAFITNNPYRSSSTATLFEIGYQLESNKLKRWETGDADTGKWNFLNNLPEIWAADNSWGTVSTIVEGVVDFQCQFYFHSSAPPYHSIYDAISDSDVTPDFAVVTLTLVHPKNADPSEIEKEKNQKTFTNQINLKTIY